VEERHGRLRVGLVGSESGGVSRGCAAEDVSGGVSRGAVSSLSSLYIALNSTLFESAVALLSRGSIQCELNITRLEFNTD